MPSCKKERKREKKVFPLLKERKKALPLKINQERKKAVPLERKKERAKERRKESTCLLCSMIYMQKSM